MKSKPKKLCLVHGKRSKPHFCRAVTAEMVHSYPPDHNFSGECKQCGDCCKMNVAIKSDQIESVLKAVIKKQDILRRIGVDPNRVIEHIKTKEETPLRSDVAAKHYSKDLVKDHCALLVPEEVIKKTGKKVSKLPRS